MVQGECGDVGSAKDAVKLLSNAFGNGKRQDKPRERRSLHYPLKLLRTGQFVGRCVQVASHITEQASSPGSHPLLNMQVVPQCVGPAPMHCCRQWQDKVLRKKVQCMLSRRGKYHVPYHNLKGIFGKRSRLSITTSIRRVHFMPYL